LKTVRRFLAVGLLLVLGGCAAVPTKPAKHQEAPATGKALVTFVRQSIWMGDGIHAYLWDGERFIGRLSAGTMVQVEVEPGEHVFMSNAENWSYATGSLEAGKTYVIKANAFPGALTMRMALASIPASDARRETWDRKMAPKLVPEEARASYETKNAARAREALQNFRDGKVTSFAQIGPGDAR
jgi:hypothetical protein